MLVNLGPARAHRIGASALAAPWAAASGGSTFCYDETGRPRPPTATRACRQHLSGKCARSSVGESIGLLSRGSQVRILPGAPVLSRIREFLRNLGVSYPVTPRHFRHGTRHGTHSGGIFRPSAWHPAWHPTACTVTHFARPKRRICRATSPARRAASAYRTRPHSVASVMAVCSRSAVGRGGLPRDAPGVRVQPPSSRMILRRSRILPPARASASPRPTDQ